MCYIRVALLLLAYFAQPPQKPPATATPPQSKDVAVPSEIKKDGSAETADATRTESEAEKELRKNADRLDNIEYVSAELRQLIRVLDRDLTAEGIYQKGPGYRTRFELNVDIAGGAGKRMTVSNDSVGYRYEKTLDRDVLYRFDLDRIMPLVEQKEIPDYVMRQIQLEFPFVRPGDMIRGYLEQVEFTKSTPDTFGERAVVVFEGHWRKSVLPAVSGSPDTSDIDGLTGLTPQYVRLVIDNESGWPLRLEMFRRTDESEYKPVYILEFLKLTIGQEIPDSAFEFKSPSEKLIAENLTEEYVRRLQAFKDKTGAKPSPTSSAVVSPKLDVKPKKSAPTSPKSKAVKEDKQK